MAGIKDYSTTQINNSDLNGISVAEGMLPSNLNNAIRALMKNTREWFNDSQWVEYGDGDAAYTAAYASGTSFTIAGVNVSAIYHEGRRIKLIAATPGTIFGTISSSSFSTNTTVNVTWDSGSLSNEAITNIYIGALSKTNNSLPTGVIATATLADGSVTTVKIAADAVNGSKIADNSINSEHYVDASIDTQHIADSQITNAKLGADSVNGSKIADDSIDSEHYVDGSIDTAHLGNSQITTAKIADNNITTAKILNANVTADKLATSSVTTAKIDTDAITAAKIVANAVGSSEIAANAVDTSELATNAVTTAKITDANVTLAKLASDSVDGSKIADDSLNSEHYVDGSIDTAHIADSQITTAKIADSNVTTAKIADDAVTAAKIADAVLITASEHAGHTPDEVTLLTTAGSDARYFRQDSSETITSGATWSAGNTHIATTAAIDARIIDLVDDVGGFVPIANETSFPNANPDVNNAAGTIVSVTTLGSSHTANGSGVVSISNGTVGNSTITLNGCGASASLPAGFGILVETTSTLNTYTFVRLIPKATEVTTVASKSVEIGRLGTADAVSDMNTLGTAQIVSDMNTLAAISGLSTLASNSSNVTTVANNITGVNSFADRYRIVSSNPTSSLDAGDLAFVTNDSALKFYNGSSWTSIAPGIANVVDDTSPQLGGDLASNGNDIVFADNDKAIFGAGSDLEIYHDGSNSFIKDGGTGSLKIQGASTIDLVNGDNTEYLAQFKHNGSVDLYYDSGKKFETTNTGATITGAVAVDTISEKTSANGVTIDSLNIKDGKLTTANSVVEANMSANSVDSDSYVDGSIDTAHIANSQITVDKMAANSVDSNQYVDGSIDTAHIANSQVTADKLASNAVTTAKVAADAITGAKIADDAINSEHYTNGSIDHVHLAADAVDGDNIANDSINSEHYVDASIDNAHLASDSVTAAKIADNAINSEHYTDGSIDTAHVGDDQITYAKIQNVSATNRILGRDSSGAGVIEEITAANVRTMLNVADGANNYSHPNHSGEVTSSSDGATVIADNIVDEANLKVSNSPVNGYMLTAQSGNTGGLTWAAQPSSGGMTLISSTNLANITAATSYRISVNMSGYAIMYLSLGRIATNSTGLMPDFKLGFNNDSTGANYMFFRKNADQAQNKGDLSHDDNQFYMNGSGFLGFTSNSAQGIFVYAPAATDRYKTMSFTSMGVAHGYSTGLKIFGGGQWRNNSAITECTFTATQTLNHGVIDIYGIK